MKENDNIIEYINKFAIIVKELAALGNTIPDKMQVSTILLTLYYSWEIVVIFLNYSAQSITMRNLPILLGIEVNRKAKKITSKSFMNVASDIIKN